MEPLLNDQVALVTGAGRGFGRAIAEALADAGAAVALLARSGAEVEQVAAGIRDRGGRALALRADVTSRVEVEQAVAATAVAFGPVTLLVNNAGMAGPFGPMAATDPDDWWAAQKVHLYAPLVAAHAVLPAMLAAGSGRVINIASRAATMFQPGLSAYVVGKSAQVNWAAHLDAEVKDQGVRVFALQPGDAPTAFAHGTLAAPAAQQHLPGMLEILRDWIANVDPAPVLHKCGERVVALAAGQYDALAGRYMDVDWNWDELAVTTDKAEGDKV
jgi:NAD(P)-dependent dehydrogenase (short-subunit alcohol dehydrogenase family)